VTTFLPSKKWQEMREVFTTAIVGIQTRSNVTPIIIKDGRQRYIEWYEKTLTDRNGTVLGLLSTGQDVTEKRSMQKKLEEMALHDALTGLYNRKVLEEKLLADIELAQSRKEELSLLMLDLDHFKRINDTYGHLEGDNVIRWVADILKHSIRKRDYIARYGGEEFTIVLPETSLQQAEKLAESLRKNISEQDIATKKGNRLQVTVSIGVASLSGQIQSHQTLLQYADTALYVAKRDGRNQVRTA
jgi:diguanylate cyclase (GGDEF)-like protein